MSEELRNSLYSQADINLKQRLNIAPLQYNNQEISSIENLNTSLFPEDYKIDLKTTNLLRSLCALSRCSLKNTQSITSHRGIIGKPIVWAKKLLWRFIHPQIEPSFEALSEFTHHCVTALTQNIYRCHELENNIIKLQSSNNLKNSTN